MTIAPFAVCPGDLPMPNEYAVVNPPSKAHLPKKTASFHYAKE
jgi:hypothetical protein